MRALPALLACSLVLPGCARSTAHQAGRVEVVAGVYPLAYVAERIGGAHVHVTDLTPAGAEPHDIELSPAQVGEVQQAGLVLLVHGLQAALDAAARGNVLDAAQVGAPPAPGLAKDPHVWQDPVRMSAIATEVAGRMAARDTAHASDYTAGAAALVADLRRLDADIRAALGHCARHDIVTSHEAFGHFAARYGLHQVGIAGISPDADPSPRRLADIAAYVRTHDVTTVFTESLVSPRVAETVAREAHVRTAVLDPIEGVRPGDDYFTVMRRNVAALRVALGCT
jgi:zinc transport system substrate-binding protein